MDQQNDLKDDSDAAYLASYEASNKRRRIIIIVTAVVIGLALAGAFFATIGSLGKMSGSVQDALGDGTQTEDGKSTQPADGLPPSDGANPDPSLSPPSSSPSNEPAPTNAVPGGGANPEADGVIDPEALQESDGPSNPEGDVVEDPKASQADEAARDLESPPPLDDGGE